MTATEILLGRNAVRVQTMDPPPVSLTPRLQTIVLTCADHRVDPAHILGIDLGEAIVVRNLGGRVTTDFIRSLVVLATIAGIEELSTDVELVIVQHTDCGLSRLGAESLAPLMSEYLGVDVATVPESRLEDPSVAVGVDIRRLQDDPFVPGNLVVSGVVYDVVSGRAELLAPARPLDDH